MGLVEVGGEVFGLVECAELDDEALRAKPRKRGGVVGSDRAVGKSHDHASCGSAPFTQAF
jgi:hypothetical protein